MAVVGVSVIEKTVDSHIYVVYIVYRCFFFFFQAEDGIRDVAVTGVQTCALPISFHLARISTLSSRARPRRSRATTLANSLPSVVGLAVWPWVRDSMGSVACS